MNLSLGVRYFVICACAVVTVTAEAVAFLDVDRLLGTRWNGEVMGAILVLR